MIGVGVLHRDKRITKQASYDDSSLDTAIAMGESLARHNNDKIIVFLYSKGSSKVTVLKRIKRVRTGFLGLKQKIVVI